MLSLSPPPHSAHTRDILAHILGLESSGTYIHAVYKNHEFHLMEIRTVVKDLICAHPQLNTLYLYSVYVAVLNYWFEGWAMCKCARLCVIGRQR